MALPRPILLAALGVALVLAALLASRAAGGSEDVSSTPASPSPTTSVPARRTPAAPVKRVTRPDTTPARPAAPVERERRAPAAKPKPKLTAKSGASAGLPPAVSRAFSDKRVVMIFFTRRGAADDSATARSVRAVSRDGRVAVFRDRIGNLADYRRVVSGLGVSQTPSIVVVRPDDRKARLIEGFVDEGTLRQAVADALR